MVREIFLLQLLLVSDLSSYWLTLYPPGWVVSYLVEVRGGDVAKVGYVPSGQAAGMLLGRLLLPEPTHRFGEKPMLLLYFIISIGLQLVFWLVPNIIAGATALSIMGFFQGPFFATVSNEAYLGIFAVVGTVVLEDLLTMLGRRGFQLRRRFSHGKSSRQLSVRQPPAQLLPPLCLHQTWLWLTNILLSGFIFVVAQAGAAIFPSLTGLIAGKAGVQVLQPIVLAQLVVATIFWALVPKVQERRE